MWNMGLKNDLSKCCYSMFPTMPSISEPSVGKVSAWKQRREFLFIAPQLYVLLNGNFEAPNALQTYFKYRELNQSHHNEIEKCTQPSSALHNRTSAHVMCFINLEHNPSVMNNNSEPVYGGHVKFGNEENCAIFSLLKRQFSQEMKILTIICSSGSKPV